jgi:hypothetical protein
MLPQFLVEETIVHANGEGPAIDLGPEQGRPVMIALGVTRVVEQEALEVTILGSSDGVEWAAKPIAAFPQKFYTGTSQLLVDLTAHPDIRFLRAKWTAQRWGRGNLEPSFTFYVFARAA